VLKRRSKNFNLVLN